MSCKAASTRWSELRQQPVGFLVGQVAHSPRRFLEHPHCRHPVQPLPLARALAKNRAHERERAVDGGIAAAVGLLGSYDVFDHVAVDAVELLVAEVAVQPAQLRLVFFGGCLVGLFRTPPDDGVVPRALRVFVELVLPPRLGLQPIVVLLRFGLVAGFSASSYALARWGGEVDPPDGASLAYGHADLPFSEATRNACR